MPTKFPYYSTAKTHVASYAGFPSNFGGKSILIVEAAKDGVVAGAVYYAAVNCSICLVSS